MSNVDFVSAESWSRRATQLLPTGIEPFAVKGSGGGKVRITPALAHYRNLTVSGRNWLAISSDRKCTLDAMVHDPSLYRRARSGSSQNGLVPWVDAKDIRFLAQPSVLVGGSTSYYHWLVDHLPRLLLVKAKGLLGDRIVLLNGDKAAHQEQALELLSIPDRQRYRLEADSAVFATDVLVPTIMARASVTHPCVAAMLRSAFPARHTNGPHRIYLCSASEKQEALANESEVSALFHANGFERVDPASMDFRSRIDLFANARIVAGVHNEQMANLLFSPSGTQVIEIQAPRTKALSMFMISLVLGHSHIFVRPSLVQHGWQVDVDSMSNALDERIEISRQIWVGRS